MKKKSLLAAAVLAALMVPQVAGAEGFGIVQWSAEGVAMGGARMFAENDVSMVAANPASLTKFQGKGIGMNATYISPHGRWETTGENDMGLGVGLPTSGRNRIHPGIVPGTYYVQQMTEKDWWGIGAYTRYGMVSGFQPGSRPAMNNLFAKMNGLSITPVYAHKFDKKWSAGLGAEISYVGLEMNKEHFALFDGTNFHLKGESKALGWNASANYAFDDKNEMGIVYRSKVKHSLEADMNKRYGAFEGDAYGVVTLPDQWTIGYNHKFDKKNRVELNATRTNWHTYDALNIQLSGMTTGSHTLGYLLTGNPMNAFPPNMQLPNPKNWKDTWRYAIGYEHKFSDKYTGMLGFSFDDHAIPYKGGDFIVPTGVRRTYSIGLQYNDKKQTVAVAYAHEQIGALSFEGGSTDPYKSVHTHNNYAKIISVGYSYKF